LSKAIIQGELLPGEIINSKIIADKLGISRTPVREACKRLEQEGLLQKNKNRRQVIREISYKDAMEVYEIREVLEGALIGLISNKITNAQMKKLEELISEELSYFDSQTDNLNTEVIRKVLEINNKFHLLLYKCAENKRLYSILESLYKDLLHYRILNLQCPIYDKKSVEEHKEILDALKNGDVKLAKEAVQRHINNAKTMVANKCK